MSVLTYSTVPGSNAAALASGGSLAEGATTIPSLNDKMRQMLADIAQLYADTQTGITTAGTAPAYTASTASGHAVYDNMMAFRIRAHADCPAGAATINVNSLGAKALKVFGGSGVRDPFAGEIKQNMVYDCAYVTALNCVVITGQTVEYTVFGASLMAAATQAAARTILGLTPGTDVQAYSAALAGLAGLSDPNAQRVYGWDDTANVPFWYSPGSGISFAGNQISATTPLLGSWTYSSNVTSIPFPDLGGWAVVKIVGRFTVSDAVIPTIQFSPDNGATWRTTSYSGDIHDGVSTTGMSSGITIGRVAGAGSSYTLNAEIADMDQSTVLTQGSGASFSQSRSNSFCGFHSTAETINAIRLANATFSAGMVRVYGIARA